MTSQVYSNNRCFVTDTLGERDVKPLEEIRHLLPHGSFRGLGQLRVFIAGYKFAILSKGWRADIVVPTDDGNLFAEMTNNFKTKKLDPKILFKILILVAPPPVRRLAR